MEDQKIIETGMNKAFSMTLPTRSSRLERTWLLLESRMKSMKHKIYDRKPKSNFEVRVSWFKRVCFQNPNFQHSQEIIYKYVCTYAVFIWFSSLCSDTQTWLLIARPLTTTSKKLPSPQVPRPSPALRNKMIYLNELFHTTPGISIIYQAGTKSYKLGSNFIRLLKICCWWLCWGWWTSIHDNQTVFLPLKKLQTHPKGNQWQKIKLCTTKDKGLVAYHWHEG